MPAPTTTIGKCATTVDSAEAASTARPRVAPLSDLGESPCPGGASGAAAGAQAAHPRAAAAACGRLPSRWGGVEVAAAAATTRVSADLPTLAPGNYVLNWTAEGADGHEMTGAVRFMVH